MKKAARLVHQFNINKAMHQEIEFFCKKLLPELTIVWERLLFHQIHGVAMGMSPAPTIANLYFAIYEATHIFPLLSSFLFFLKRFINDGLGIWLHDQDPDIHKANWILFKTLINAMGLKWTSTKLSKKVIFMDMTMTIEISGNQLVTSLYAKPIALYQYIPPTSCHPPGALTSLILDKSSESTNSVQEIKMSIQN